MKKMAQAFAPATVANVAVGFDILGFALEKIGETALVSKIEKSREVIIEPIRGYPEISLDPLKNTATAGLVRLIEERSLNFGFRVRLDKNIPVGSGLGGSSTSAVATMVAANSLLSKKLSLEQILDYALTGEAVASGSRHGDNVGPCLTGGLVFVRSEPKIEIVKIRIPRQLRCVIILPEISIRTKEARELLNPQVDLRTVIEQTSHLTGFLIGCMKSDFNLIRSSLKDVIVEPQRSKLIPGFYELQKTAIASGALGFSISGSGPAMFALAQGPGVAKKIQTQLLAKAKSLGLPLRASWLSAVASRGARLVKAT